MDLCPLFPGAIKGVHSTCAWLLGSLLSFLVETAISLVDKSMLFLLFQMNIFCKIKTSYIIYDMSVGLWWILANGFICSLSVELQEGLFGRSSGKLSCCLSLLSIGPVSASSIAINPRTVDKVKWFKWLPHLWFILLFTLIQAEEWENIPDATIETIYFDLSVIVLFILAPVWHRQTLRKKV